MAVTRRQKEVLDFLETFVNRNGYSPSFEEIARGMSLKSLATVHKYITNLEKKGMGWLGGELGCHHEDRAGCRSEPGNLLPTSVLTRKDGADDALFITKFIEHATVNVAPTPTTNLFL